MRLADVKWQKPNKAISKDLNIFVVLDADQTKWILYHYEGRPYVNIWNSYNFDGNDVSFLELACWLADKQPA